jgi:sugar-specific transcriptional regulator TrmB
MIKLEYIEEITDTGLSKEQAIVYEVLLKIGESPASTVAKAVPSNIKLSRPLVYKILEELIDLDLASKFEKTGKIARFTPKHPIGITKVIDEQKEKIERVKKHFLTTSGKLTSLFNLMSGKPGVQFFEGEDGVWEVLMDSLTTTEEILTYADLEAIEKYIPTMNAEYSILREEKSIKKRGLVIDSPKTRDFLRSYNKGVTTTKLIGTTKNMLPFQTIMQIYDNKVSYITLTDSYFISIIITNEHIANTQKYLFNSMWESIPGEVTKQ